VRNYVLQNSIGPGPLEFFSKLLRGTVHRNVDRYGPYMWWSEGDDTNRTSVNFVLCSTFLQAAPKKNPGVQMCGSAVAVSISRTGSCVWSRLGNRPLRSGDAKNTLSASVQKILPTSVSLVNVSGQGTYPCRSFTLTSGSNQYGDPSRLPTQTTRRSSNTSIRNKKILKVFIHMLV
jgi:hypothetical protein